MNALGTVLVGTSWLVAMCLPAAAPVYAASGQTNLSLASGSASPGSTVVLNLSLSSTGPDFPSSLQWTVGYSTADIASITWAAGPSATSAGKSVSCGTGTGSMTCIVAGLNNSTISNGVVATATVTIAASPVNATTQITITNPVASDPTGSPIAASSSGGSISISFPTVSVTVTTSPSGLQITVDGSTYTAPRTFQWTPGSTHTIGTSSPQGSGGTRYVFNSWSDGGAQTHSITTPNTPTTYTAVFNTEFKLITAVSPAGSGSIQASPYAADGFYPSGTNVQLTAVASSGRQFSSWSGDASGSANPVSLTMNAPKSVTANFGTTAQGITITTNPSGLQIIVDGATYTAPQTFQWQAGSSHSIGTYSPQGAGPTRYVFSSWSDSGAQTHSITVPNGSATYTASFTTQHQLTLTATPPTGGSVQASPTSADGYYNQGAVVQLSATANPGQQFSSWTGDLSGSLNPASITMNAPKSVAAQFSAAPSQGVTIATAPSGLQIIVDGVTYTAPQTFQWAAGSSHTIGVGSPQGSGGTRYLFTSWSDGGAQTHTITAPANPTTYTANFRTQYRLTTGVSPAASGVVQVSPPSSDGYYDSGAFVQLSASANPGSTFASWSGSVSGSNNPVTITMNAPVNVTALFTGPPGTGITITTNPPGLEIIVDGVRYTAPHQAQWNPGSTHTIGAVTPQGSSGTRYVFRSWSDGGAPEHSVTAPANATTFVANFTVQHQLTTTVIPPGAGWITTSPASPDGFYDEGTFVQLSAQAAGGFQFASWSGGFTGTSPTVQVGLSGPTYVNANFTANTKGTPGGVLQSVTVTTSPAGLQILVDGVAYSSPRSFQWAVGSTHTIGVNPNQGTTGAGWRFSFRNWSDGGAATHTVTATGAPTTYTAFFEAQYKLSVIVEPAGQGVVQLSPDSADGFYSSGATVRLVPIAAGGYQFDSWQGDLSGSAPVQSLAMDGPRFVTARFAAAGDCSAVPSVLSLVAPAEGETGKIAVTAPSNCSWTASSQASWITLTGTQGAVGSGVIRFTVEPNQGPLRSGTILVAGKTVTLVQSSAACMFDFNVTAASPKMSSASSTITANVLANNSCQWASSTSHGWLSLTPGGTLSGSGFAQVNASSNDSPRARTGSLNVGGHLTPILQPGTVFDQVFLDVPEQHPFGSFINMIRMHGITTGCTPTNYCPDDGITRGEMAAFIIRALFGENFTIPFSPYFTDVAPSHPHFRYIQKLRELGITVGCSPTTFCPDQVVTRGQMAVFLVRARLGISSDQTFKYLTTPAFQDVAPSHIFFPYIQKMKQMGVTSGCSATAYCPDALTTRGQMAVFLVRALLTP